AHETRQFLDVRGLVAAELHLQGVQRVLAGADVELGHAVGVVALDHAVLQAVLGARLDADKRVAGHALAALDRLKQEGRTAPAQLEVDAGGGLQVGRQLAEQGDGGGGKGNSGQISSN